jgi:hypothetical protein
MKNVWKWIFGSKAKTGTSIPSEIRALDRITDQRRLEKIVREANGSGGAYRPALADAAVSKITDQRIIFDLIMNREQGDTFVRNNGVYAAIDNVITDQNLLKKIAHSAPDVDHRRHAIRKTTDAQTLFDIANGNDHNTRFIAVDNLDDQVLLTKLCNTPNQARDVLTAALKKLDNKHVLSRILVGSSEPILEMMCARRLKALSVASSDIGQQAFEKYNNVIRDGYEFESDPNFLKLGPNEKTLRLIILACEWGRRHSFPPDECYPQYEAVRQIGVELSKGGLLEMQQVAKFVNDGTQNVSGSMTLLNNWWDGIGGWLS